MQQGQENNTCIASDSRFLSHSCKSSHHLCITLPYFTPDTLSALVLPYTHFAVNPFKLVLPHWLRTVVFYSSPLLARLFLFINYGLLKSLSLRLIHATRNRLPILCFSSLLLHHIGIYQLPNTLSLLSWLAPDTIPIQRRLRYSRNLV
jgi:hypothetical protein